MFVFSICNRSFQLFDEVMMPVDEHNDVYQVKLKCWFHSVFCLVLGNYYVVIFLIVVWMVKHVVLGVILQRLDFSVNLGWWISCFICKWRFFHFLLGFEYFCGFFNFNNIFLLQTRFCIFKWLVKKRFSWIIRIFFFLLFIENVIFIRWTFFRLNFKLFWWGL